jgi:hypothetical protein
MIALCLLFAFAVLFVAFRAFRDAVFIVIGSAVITGAVLLLASHT